MINSRGKIQRPFRREVVPLLVSDCLHFQFKLNQYRSVNQLFLT